MDDIPAPAIKKIDVTIARLRLLLADISAREGSLAAQLHTFRDQRDKLITFALYGDSTLDSVLAMLADVEERCTHVEATARLLVAVRRRAEAELESLQLTKGIEEARGLLAQLKAREAAEPGPDAPAMTRDEIQAEISRLQALIAEASERAARSLDQRSTEQRTAEQRTAEQRALEPRR